jgi:hypothetical protein
MKIPEPADFNKSAANGFKFWRYITIPNTAPNGLVLYLNVADINCFGSNTFTDGYISIFDPFIAVCAPMVAIADIDDNQWHSHELRVTLNSVGASDGAIEYWVDGVQTYSDTSVNFGYGAEGADYGLYRFGIGMGNTTEDVDWNQTEWSALSFDNVEVSDEYIGPLESSDTTPPSAPSGLGVS